MIVESHLRSDAIADPKIKRQRQSRMQRDYRSQSRLGCDQVTSMEVGNSCVFVTVTNAE